jgi:hypothetical protein
MKGLSISSNAKTRALAKQNDELQDDLQKSEGLSVVCVANTGLAL